VVLSSGDDVTVGTLRIEARASGDDFVIRMQDGARKDTRHVTGQRDVKLGAHRIRFDEAGSKVTVTVRAYAPASPLTSEDALLAADEAMSPKSQGPVECVEPTLSADGKTFGVRCRDTDTAGSDKMLHVDRLTGAIVP